MRWDISFDELAAVLQIRMGNRDTLGLFIYIFSVKKNIIVTHHKNRSIEKVLMRGHNIYFP